jgi:hypothetical protein
MLNYRCVTWPAGFNSLKDTSFCAQLCSDFLAHVYLRSDFLLTILSPNLYPSPADSHHPFPVIQFQRRSTDSISKSCSPPPPPKWCNIKIIIITAPLSLPHKLHFPENYRKVNITSDVGFWSWNIYWITHQFTKLIWSYVFRDIKKHKFEGGNKPWEGTPTALTFFHLSQPSVCLTKFVSSKYIFVKNYIINIYFVRLLACRIPTGLWIAGVAHLVLWIICVSLLLLCVSFWAICVLFVCKCVLYCCIECTVCV